MGLLPEVEAKPITIKAPHEWEVFRRFENYRDNGGVLPENIFNRYLDLLDEALDASSRGECRFITRRQEHFLRKKYGESYDSIGRFFFPKERQGQAESMQVPEDVVFMYCILRKDVSVALGASREEKAEIIATDEMKKLFRTELWSDQLIFAEALLMTGKIKEYQEFRNNNQDIFSRRENERNRPKVKKEEKVAAYKPPPRSSYLVGMLS
jgi:hypothetical protein